jgi:hypothetical protein
MAQGRHRWLLGATLGLAGLLAYGTSKILSETPIVHDMPQVITFEEKTPKEDTITLPKIADATPIETSEITPSPDSAIVPVQEVVEGHTFFANVYNFGLGAPDSSDVILETNNFTSPSPLTPKELKDVNGNSYHRFTFEGLQNGLYHLSIQYSDGTPSLEDLIMNGGAISDYVVMYDGDHEEWYSLPAVQHITGKVYDKETNAEVTEGRLQFTSQYDTKIRPVANLTEYGFEVMVPVIPSITGTEQEKYTISGTFSGTDYVAEQWRELLVDGMRLGTRKGETLDVLVLHEDTLSPVTNVNVYLLDHQGKIVRASYDAPETTDEHGMATFRAVDPKNKGRATRHYDQQYMVFADGSEGLYQTNLRDVSLVKVPLDANYGGRVVVLMNNKTSPLEVNTSPFNELKLLSASALASLSIEQKSPVARLSLFITTFSVTSVPLTF